MENRQIQLVAQPDGMPTAADFVLRSVCVPEIGPGQFLVRNLELSLDPYIRTAIAGRHIGHRRLEAGEVIYGSCVGRVERSRHPDYPEGQLVVIESGWQDYHVASGSEHERIRKVRAATPLSAHLGILGMPGLTAWAGIEQLARVRLGDTVVVSGAAGAVGGAAGQLARAKGCRVVGLVGSAGKASLVTGRYGFDAAVNYRDADWTAQLARHCPDGIDAFFDCVGGPMLNAVTPLLAHYGSIVCCGLAPPSDRGGMAEAPAGFNTGLLMARRARMMGLIVYDYFDRFDRYERVAGALLSQGRLVLHEDRVSGLEQAPAHFERLMRGETSGKAIVTIAEAA